jgi:DNA-binding MarR family transcriptional regulator
MESNSWAMRKLEPTNRRTVQLQVTPRGKALLKRSDEIVDRREQSMFESMSEDDAHALPGTFSSMMAKSSLAVDAAALTLQRSAPSNARAVPPAKRVGLGQ